MGIAPISNENIKVGYISEDDGYVKGVSIAQANAYEALNPDTTFIFLNGDNKVEYLSIDEVNQYMCIDAYFLSSYLCLIAIKTSKETK